MNKKLILVLIILCSACESENDDLKSGQAYNLAVSALSCSSQSEELDYQVYPMTSDGYRIGDVAAFYDSNESNFKIYFIKDIWNDSTNERHPWYVFETDNMYSYTEFGEVLPSSSALCDQDFAVGAGSVIEFQGQYYAFYTGHNPNSGGCSSTEREGILLATSNDPTNGFNKVQNFTTIYVPKGLGFDENDNFRDPFVFEDGGNFHMLVSARKNIDGIWRGVIINYQSSDLMNWNYNGVLYDGGQDNFWMMECPEIFTIGNNYYLIFSDQVGKNLLYRKSTSLNGNWSKPSKESRFAGKGVFAAKSAVDQYGDRYLFGWKNNLTGDSDSGNWKWAGNLITHKIYALPNGDLAATIPHTLKNYLETSNYIIAKDSQWGNVTKTSSTNESYQLISNANFDIANVIYDPINEERFKISATISFNSSNKDFGFMIGACDGYENFYSLRFIPSENKFSFNKERRSNLTPTSMAENDVPIELKPNTNYDIQIVIENSILVVYINDKAAIANRIYKSTNTHWGIYSENSDVKFENIQVTKF
ncbi:DUF4975 domain-containing protein [Zunongwangia sp. SCSIO 43204]|uniref:glycoside hydrolase family 32 protein n=1 Tax=Zunongwangia sp. SCSIO 43204 TaxID=2779359 RepID=UPI001CA93F72|nr:glycoside hydrolase family 32 protein [Zunongwangia sp. SCSIO 43204]UAB84126.1 DUF4975 domain-containing protein [Zunongwangia sp. SCSIO 43204]